MKRIDLADGSYLTGFSLSNMTLFPEERAVSVTIVDGTATLSTSGPSPEIVATVAVAESDRGSSPKRSKPAQPGRSDDAKRWDTLNEFEDEIAPHLTLAEQAVWHYLFRHCRNGRAEGSVRLIAQGRRIDFKTGAAALRHLIAVGLVREILKSVSKYARSVYGINSHPAACQEACVQVDAGRKARRKERKPPPIRDKESRLRSAKKAKPKPR